MKYIFLMKMKTPQIPVRIFLTLCLSLFFSAAPLLRAQNSGKTLTVSFADNSKLYVTVSDDLILSFDGRQMEIRKENENPQIYQISDVRSFAYNNTESSVSAPGRDDSEPVVNFGAEGISISFSGQHSYRLISIDGTVLQQQNFSDSCFIDAGSLYAGGTAILQIDGNKSLKFIK